MAGRPLFVYTDSINRPNQPAERRLHPFRAIDYRQLQRLEMRDENFGWTIEMQIKAAKQVLRCLEVPVPYRKRVGRSKISGTLMGTMKAGYKILWTIAKYGFFQRNPIGGIHAGGGIRAKQMGNG